jgi:hypothetical protein
LAEAAPEAGEYARIKGETAAIVQKHQKTASVRAGETANRAWTDANPASVADILANRALRLMEA